jgi:hypothetical protein
MTHATILFSPLFLDARSGGDRAVECCDINIFRRLESAFGKLMKVTEKMQKYSGNFLAQPSKAFMGHDHAFAGIDPRSA